jgi:hypothetical protein
MPEAAMLLSRAWNAAPLFLSSKQTTPLSLNKKGALSSGLTAIHDSITLFLKFGLRS